MRKNSELDTCPICKGSGKFHLPKRMEIDHMKIKERIAKELYDQGYSMRQIQRALGYRSVRSISIIVHKPNK